MHEMTENPCVDLYLIPTPLRQNRNHIQGNSQIFVEMLPVVACFQTNIVLLMVLITCIILVRWLYE